MIKPAILLLGIALSVLSGCASSKPATQLLLPFHDATASATLTAVQPKLHIRSCTLPSYLNRREMVKLVNGNQLIASQDFQWGMPLDKAIRDLMIAQAKSLLGEENVLRYPSQDHDAIILDITFNRCSFIDQEFVLDAEIVTSTGKSARKTYSQKLTRNQQNPFLMLPEVVSQNVLTFTSDIVTWLLEQGN